MASGRLLNWSGSLLYAHSLVGCVWEPFSVSYLRYHHNSLLIDLYLGWSSPALPSMESNSSTPHINASETEDQKQTKTWIGSSTNLGALAGALLGGISNYL